MEPKTNNSARLHSVIALRNAIGFIGIFLPFLLLLGDRIIFGHRGARVSISNYYCSGMRDVLVGALCAVGLFLIFYKGYVEDKYGKWDNRLTNVAGYAALFLALFTNSCGEQHYFSGMVHLISGFIFFLVLGIISYCLFTRTRDKQSMSKRKRYSNKIYKACGILNFACLAAMIVFYGVFDKNHPDSRFIYIFETISLIAFGLSWLVKGKSVKLIRNLIRL